MKKDSEHRVTPPPPTLRAFFRPSYRLLYLYRKLLYWSYDRKDRARSKHFANEVDRHLPTVRGALTTPFGCECAALAAEAKRDWPRAIRFRKREIRLMEKTRAGAARKTPRERRAILRNFGPNALADRYELLALELWNVGRLDASLAALDESERICRKHGVRFHGAEIRRYVQDEQKHGRTK